MARKVTTVLALRDNYTAVIKKARRYTSAFDKDVQKMTARLDKASAKKHDIKVKNSAAMKALTALEKKVAPMRNVMVKVAANIAHFKNQIKPVTDTFKKIATKAWTITLKVKDGASFILGKISKGLKTIGKGIAIGAAAVIGAGGYALSKGMALEGYNVSMAHFVGVNNPNNTAAQNQKQTDDYLKALRKNANATPFGTEEVIQAGSRAVQIAEGNTNAAMGLVKMAEDMAALTPGKTVMDAMEALADANMGEMEHMKEFGFKMSAEEFKKAGYDLFSTKSTTGKTLVQVFGGGAEKFANTTTGMWSTITGEIESDIADIGLEMAKGLKPFLEWVRDTVLPDLRKFLFDPIKGTGKTGMETLTQGIKDVYYWLKDQIPLAITTIKNVWDGLLAAFDDPNGIIRKTLGILGINVPTIGGNGKTGANSKPAYGEPTKPIPENSVFYKGAPELPTVGGRQLNLGDLAVGYFGYKGASAISKLFTGKGLLKNGVDLGVKAGKLGAQTAGDAAINVAANNPVAQKIMQKIMEKAGQTMAYAGPALLPGASVWLDNQMALSDFDYWQKTGKTFDKTTPKGALDSFAYMNVKFNEDIGKNVDEAGANFSNFMDNLLGIKRQPNGIFPDLGATWANWMKENTGNVAAGWMGTPAPGTQDPNAALYSGGMYGDFDLSKRLADLQTTGVDAVKTSIQNTDSAATGASDALNTFIGWINKVKSAGGGGYNTNQPKAAGIKRVPFDNYPALLHKGEAVLPSGEAGEYRGHGNQAGKTGNNISLNITVNGAGMDENRLASILVNKLQEVALNMA